jgi:NarL family two-component system response regulator LiaR
MQETLIYAKPSGSGQVQDRRPPVRVAVVADRETTRSALLEVLRSDPDCSVVGYAEDALSGRRLLDEPDLRVILVNLPLSGEEPGNEPGLAFIRLSKSLRPDIGILSLKRDVDEPRLRAALDAGADACCMATTPQNRLLSAIKAVAAGATWLDPEISQILLHPVRTAAAGSLSPRELEILRLVVDGYTNEEIADRLVCAPATVKTHLLHLFRKMGVHDRVSAAVAALRGGLLL